MKKILSIVFIGLFLLNICGYYFIFSLNQGVIRDKMRNLIHSGYFKNNYESLTFSDPSTDPDFKWVDKGEFRYKGKLYDLISSEVKGIMLVFHCINDTKEEQLIARNSEFRNLLNGTDAPARARNSLALQNLMIKYALLKGIHVLALRVPSTIVFFDPVFHLKSVTLSPSYPPPRSV